MRLLTTVRRRGRQPVLLGMALAMVASFFYATTHVIGRELVTGRTEPLIVSFYAVVFGTVYIALLSFRDVPKVRHVPRRGVALMAMAGVAGSIGVTVTLVALSYAPVATITPVLATNSLVSMMLAHLFLQRLEQVTLRLWIGAGLVVAGIVLISVSNA